MSHTARRQLGRRARHRRIRKRVIGMPDRPRVCVFRSHKHLQAQLINDVEAKTLLGGSTLDKQVRQAVKGGSRTSLAQALGSALAQEAGKLGITQVVFDRGGYVYHGRVKAFAEALRQGGLQF